MIGEDAAPGIVPIAAPDAPGAGTRFQGGTLAIHPIDLVIAFSAVGFLAMLGKHAPPRPLRWYLALVFLAIAVGLAWFREELVP